MAVYALPNTDALLYACTLCGAKEWARNDDELEAADWHAAPGHVFCPACKAPDGQCEPCNDIKAILGR